MDLDTPTARRIERERVQFRIDTYLIRCDETGANTSGITSHALCALRASASSHTLCTLRASHTLISLCSLRAS